MKTMTKPSKKIHDFNEDKIIGDEGESIVKRYLESLGSVKKVVDMANNKIFFHKDVDFVLERHDATKFRIEVKTDQYKSGNIYMRLSQIQYLILKDAWKKVVATIFVIISLILINCIFFE